MSNETNETKCFKMPRIKINVNNFTESSFNNEDTYKIARDIFKSLPKLNKGNKVQIKIDKRNAKTKDKFVTAEVEKDNRNTLIDEKGRKIHKMNLRRKGENTTPNK